MDDEPVAAFFDGLDVDAIKTKQKAFWTIALGGAGTYDGRGLREAHSTARGAGLDDRLFDRFIGHFRDTLAEFGVPEQKINAVLDVTDAHRDTVLGRAG